MIRKNPRGDLPQIHETAYADRPPSCAEGHRRRERSVGPYAVIRADEVDETGDMQPIHIGAHSNIQDGVVIHSSPAPP
jgi:carbonic anhydrase/acetyltransferase-like protein (isoleucine patch superfamily)